MSRQRLRESNIKWSIKLTNETLALKVIKLIEIKIFENNAKIVDVEVNEKILNFIEKYFSDNFNYFKKKNKIKINLDAGEKMGLQDYNLEFKSKSGKTLEKIEKIENLQKIIDEKVDKNIELVKEKKPNFKRKKFKKEKILKKIKLNLFLSLREILEDFELFFQTGKISAQILQHIFIDSAIWKGFLAFAIAVLISTASQPISIAWTASDACPIPASIINGTFVWCLKILIFVLFCIPKPEPMGAANGIIADAPDSSNLLHIKGSSLQYDHYFKSFFWQNFCRFQCFNHIWK